MVLVLATRLDKAYPGYCINANTILHFTPPADISLVSETMTDLYFVGMPPGTISTPIPCLRKRAWQQTDVTRRSVPYANRVRLYGLQGAEQDAGPSGLGVVRNTDDSGQRGSVPQSMQPL